MFLTIDKHMAKTFLVGVIGIFVIFSSCHSSQSPQTDAPDILITNAKIWSDSKILQEDAIAIKGNKISKLATTQELLKTKSDKTRVVDAQHKLVTPGFIDTHVHFLMGGAGLSSVQLRDAATKQEFIKRIKEFALKQGKGTWITGGDWNHENWGGEMPQASWIDSVTQYNPISLNRLDGHLILVNSLGMKIAGVDDKTKDVEGGSIERNNRHQPTGIFKDNAQDLIFNKMPADDEARENKSLQAAMQYVASHGVTSVQHMGTFQDLKVFRRNRDSLITRVYSATPLAQWDSLKMYIKANGTGDEMLRWGIVKGFMDGALGSHTAAMINDFSDKKGDKGFFINPPDSMKKWILAADKENLKIAIHAIGDRAIHTLLGIFDTTVKVNGAKDRRWKIEHFQHPTMDDIKRIHSLAVIASMQPYHAIDDGCWAEKVLGKERIKTTYAFKSILDNHGMLTFGSDWFVAPPIPLLGIYAAITRQTIDGKNPAGWVPEQKISIDDALMAYTHNAAYSEFADDKLGSIKMGYLADLAILDQDIFTIEHVLIKDVKVNMTIMNGQIVFERK